MVTAFPTQNVMDSQRLINCVREQKLHPAKKIKKSRAPGGGAAVISDTNLTALPRSPFLASALGLLPLFTESMQGEKPKNNHSEHFSSWFVDSGRDIISASKGRKSGILYSRCNKCAHISSLLE